MKKIPLTQGRYTVVDDEDYERLANYKWHIASRYAARSVRLKGRNKTMYLHWEVIGKPAKGSQVDHINQNKLDNRKSNLRIVSHSVNQRNTDRYKNNKSGYKGVCKVLSKWKAQIKHGNKVIYLGLHDTPEEASEAYQTKFRELMEMGVKSNLNN